MRCINLGLLPCAPFDGSFECRKHFSIAGRKEGVKPVVGTASAETNARNSYSGMGCVDWSELEGFDGGAIGFLARQLRGRLHIPEDEESPGNVRDEFIFDVLRVTQMPFGIIACLDGATDAEVDG